MKSTEYFSQVKRRLGIDSDYALAKALGITTQAVSKIQAGKHTMGDATALKVAEILELRKGVVLADVLAERSKNAAVTAALLELVADFLELLLGRARQTA